jgi:hypothetical protein
LPVPVLAAVPILVTVANLNTRVAAIIAASAVAAGGAFAVTEAVAGSTPATPRSIPAAPAPSTASGPTGQAAVLNGALAGASFTSSTSAGASAQLSAAQLRRLRRAIARLRRLGGMHGEYTFEAKNGPRTLAFERGTVTGVAGLDVTVRAEDGTTWTWVLNSASVVRQDGTRTTPAALADGKPVFAAGPVTGGTHDAALVVIRPAAKKLS